MSSCIPPQDARLENVAPVKFRIDDVNEAKEEKKASGDGTTPPASSPVPGATTERQ
jgi:hypothetical protein